MIKPSVPWWLAMALCAMAGGMGWGIRGQYGHESGAMIAGLLVSSVVALLFCRESGGLATARAMAFCTIGIGIGGSMTYGQIVGQTQNLPMVGDWAHWRLGMLGLALTGGIWIGFGGVFLGMGLSGVRYSPWEILLVMLGLPFLYFVGVWVFNSPFDPKNGQLPWIYFSNAVDKPRFECWGGLLFALIGLIIYVGRVRKDTLAWRLALFGVVGGVLGFPGGQCWQSWHAWNVEAFRTGEWAKWDPHINWWNLMETSFGMIMGGAIGLGVWFNRALIRPEFPKGTEFQAYIYDAILFLIHFCLLGLSEFYSVPYVREFYGLGLGMAILPMIACAQSRLWPALLLGPVLVMPIAGKTLRRLTYESQGPITEGWIFYFALPMACSLLFCGWLWVSLKRGWRGDKVGALTLLFGSWIFFVLNFTFFENPWPWEKWTSRTPSALVFFVCLVSLTAACLRVGCLKQATDFSPIDSDGKTSK